MSLKTVGPTRQQLTERAVYLRTEINRIFADAAYWNRTYINEEPIDPDPDGQLAKILNGINRMLEKEGLGK